MSRYLLLVSLLAVLAYTAGATVMVVLLLGVGLGAAITSRLTR